jgi:hypothetical protein
MPDYEQVKNWFEKNKDKIVLAVCFVLVFFVGVGTDRFERKLARQTIQSNYTTNYNKTPVKPVAAEAGQGTVAALPVVAGTSTPGSCIIKGNISTGGKKIYHVPGGASYKIVKPEQCFNTEAEAVAAGYVKAGR